MSDVDGAFATGQAKSLNALLHAPGFCLPPVRSISELHLPVEMLPVLWLQLKTIIPSANVRKLLSKLLFSELKLC